MSNMRITDEPDIRILLRKGLRDLKSDELTFAYQDMDNHLNIEEGSTARLIDSVVSEIPSLEIEEKGTNLVVLRKRQSSGRLLRG